MLLLEIGRLAFQQKRPILNKKDSCAVCFDANFEQHDSCARCFTQALPSEKYGPIWSKTTVAQSDLRPISSNSTCFLQVLSKTANQISWILLTTHTNLGKLTVASPLSHRSSVKRPIASNRTAAPRWAHFFRFLFSSRFLWKIYVFLLLLTKGAHFKQNWSCA